MITTAPELIYMLKVNIGIALFYAFYKLFCCRDTFFQWRRIALLSFLALSFLYPLMDMQAWVKEQPAINELADYYALMMLTETNTSTATVVTAPVAIPTPDLLDIIKFVYWIGILLLSARFMIQLSSIFRLVLKSKNINVDQISIRSLSEPANPFSLGVGFHFTSNGIDGGHKDKQHQDTRYDGVTQIYRVIEPWVV